jgi:hypothetical protein
LKISGQATLRGRVHDVYRALNDPGVLVHTIPGCERLERTGTDEYRMMLTAGVASIKGAYVGEVRLTDHEAPHAFTMRAVGSGAPGTVSADVKVTLREHGDGGTLLTYDADAVVGGMIGGVGQRMLSGVAKKTAGEFFAAVDAALAGGFSQEGSPVGGQRDTGQPSWKGEPHAPAVYTSPAAGPALPAGFLTGALVGAAIALAGAVVGGLLARRPTRPR